MNQPHIIKKKELATVLNTYFIRRAEIFNIKKKINKSTQNYIGFKNINNYLVNI